MCEPTLQNSLRALEGDALLIDSRHQRIAGVQATASGARTPSSSSVLAADNPARTSAVKYPSATSARHPEFSWAQPSHPSERAMLRPLSPSPNKIACATV